MEGFLKEHWRRLSDAEKAREERQRRLRQRNMAYRQAEATERIAFRAIDSVFDVISPMVRSMARHSTVRSAAANSTEKSATG